MIPVPALRYRNHQSAVMAQQRAVEGRLLRSDFHRGDQVTECSHSNISILKDGVFCTAPTDAYILLGIARARLLAACKRLGISTWEEPFTLEEMMDADEVIVSSTSNFCIGGVRSIKNPLVAKPQTCFCNCKKQYSKNIGKRRTWLSKIPIYAKGADVIIKKSENVAMNVYFDEANQPNPRVQMGKLILQPGERRPKSGFACHQEDEYSYVISGEAHSVLEDGQDFTGVAGDAQLIEAGEQHYNYNDTDALAEIIWMLVKRD